MNPTEQPMTPMEQAVFEAELLSFELGAKYVLTYLREVYGEGLEETDIWTDYFPAEDKSE
jgi:hypothetical protein